MDEGEQRPIFSVLGWGAPGAAGFGIGVAAVIAGNAQGIIGVLVGGAMLWYARRLRRRGVRW